MRYALFSIAALVGAFALSACETMSAEECAAADWRALGFNDAASAGADRFGNRAESCAERGFAADGAAYASGFAEGLYRFCQPPNGFQFARRGGTFTGSCPAELQYEFAGAYNDGRRVWQAGQELSSAESTLRGLEQRLRELDDDIRGAQVALDAATTDADRTVWRNELDEHYRERRKSRDDLEDADRRIYYARRRIDDLRYEIGQRWAPW